MFNYNTVLLEFPLKFQIPRRDFKFYRKDIISLRSLPFKNLSPAFYKAEKHEHPYFYFARPHTCGRANKFCKTFGNKSRGGRRLK